ncbi:HD-GYP domain-containing protein [Bacillus weihaiensis]|uniref:HD-GYP domain-containing protein n=1 Tax=Bacillus weihaiensis TaxID=1547283 RepID=A0A1L3MRP4_9BACI|nr:HD domain-containing protein [Bacillus weihaiensis]APH05029.1 hypothetical protein A9C19_09860 [Bacillus weihaiensis]
MNGNEFISFDLVGSELQEDIYSEQGILLLKKGITLNENHILLLHKYKFGEKILIKQEKKKEEPVTAEQYRDMITIIKETFQQIIAKEKVNFDNILPPFYQLVTTALQDLEIMKVIQQTGPKENYLYQHSLNVGILSAMIGKILGYAKKDCLLLAEMGLFHDLGMIHYKDIVEKNEKLTEQEYQSVKDHTKLGYLLLRSQNELDNLVAEAALLHHERINGAGYPRGKKLDEVSLYIQIISVADCFNAMCNNPYMNQKEDFECMYELINEAEGNSLNPAVVIPFIRFLMRQQLHKQVTLSDSSLATIVFIHENEPHQPLVQIGDEDYIDLRKQSTLKIVNIEEEVATTT